MKSIDRGCLSLTTIVAAGLAVSSPALAEAKNGLELKNNDKTPETHAPPALPTANNDLPQYQLGQIRSVDEFSDIPPGHWARDAIVNLVERYDCLAGYPDGTFRGNRTLTRYEFATALDACVDSIRGQLAGGGELPDMDLDTIDRLQADFAAELAQLRGRVDSLEDRVAFLEDHQFSTTTKLSGRVEMSMVQAFGDRQAVPSGNEPTEGLDTQVILGGTAILYLDTSFSGEDLLSATLVGGNLTFYGEGVTGTNMTGLVYGVNTSGGIDRNTGSDILLSTLTYKFPLGDRGQAMIAANNGFFDSILTNYNYAETISLFNTGNLTYFRGAGSGVGFNYQLSDTIDFGAVYLAGSPDASSPQLGRGLFNGQYSAMTQVAWKPSDAFHATASYGHYYSPEPGSSSTNITGFTGSQYAQLPFGSSTATSSDIYSLDLGFRFSDTFDIASWFGYITAEAESSFAGGSRGDNAEMWYGALAGRLIDLGVEGSELVAVVGIPPKVTDNDFAVREDDDTSIHLEAYYTFPIDEGQNVWITPGFIGILNPEHNNENNDIWIGTLSLSLYF